MEDGVKISELTQLTALNGEGSIPIINNNETKKINIVDLVYPVGAIYISVNSTNPSTLFGGTWEQIQGRYLMGAGKTSQNTNTYHGTLPAEALTWDWQAGDTLGEYDHILSTNEMPSHSHSSKINLLGGFTGASANLSDAGGSWSYGSTDFLYDTGGGQAHNNMPPSLVVYMWKRTA